MHIQESLVTDKQIALELHSENGNFRLPIEGKDYYFPTLEKVHEAFLNQNTYDTIKLTHKGKKSYLHLFMDEIEVFDTKNALRQRLSQDSQGMWAEIRDGKKHYYKEERGWRSTSYKEITEQQCLERLKHTSTMTKALGIGLGMLALLPGAVEFARHLPIGTKEAAMGLVALNQKSPVLGAVGYSLLPKQAEAQAVGTEFQVNTYNTSNQQYSSIAPLNDGGFVITWQSYGQDGDRDGIYGKRYDSGGVATGPEFQVNTYITSPQQYSRVAPLNNGGFVVTWESNGQDGDLYGIYGQRYDSNGAAAGIEFQVNTNTTSDQRYPDTAPLNNGGFVITWQSTGQDGDSGGIYGQRYDSVGFPAGSEFQVNNYTTNNQIDPSIAPLSDGGFIVAWQSTGQDGDSGGIYAQRYDSIGASVGAEFQVNTYTTLDQKYPDVTSLINGDFVVIWVSTGQDGDGDSIYGQRYDLGGVPIGSEFQINTYTRSHQTNPSIAPLNDGGFVVVWQDLSQDGDGTGIYGQRYGSNGLAVSSEFQVNTNTVSAQSTPSIASPNDGGFVVTWSSFGQDGNLFGIYGQRYDASGNPIPLQISATTTVIPASSTTQSSPSRTNATRSVIPTQSPLPTPSPTPVLSTSMLPSSTIASTSSSQRSNGSTPLTSTTPSATLSTTSSMLTSSTAPGSNTLAAVTTQSSTKATSPYVATVPTSSNPTIASVENIVYEESYPIVVNDQVVGTYTISGGTGLLDSGNPNIIYFDFDPSFQPEEGQIITLFYVPEEEVALWESIEIEGESYECLEARGQVTTNQGRSSYQMVFEDTECLAIAPMVLATALPLTLN